MTTLTLVRHGQTDWNLQQRIQGSTDIPLNDTGRQQAAETGERLRGGSWTGIVASPLIRALETARIISGVFGLGEPEIEAQLVERAYGEGEGLDAAELAERYPEGMDTIPGIELREEVTHRVLPALESIALAHPGGNLLVVAHGGVIASAVRYLTEGELPRGGERIANGSTHRFRYADGLLTLQEFNGETVADPIRSTAPTAFELSSPS
jgi:uncharacterized phosphatase